MYVYVYNFIIVQSIPHTMYHPYMGSVLNILRPVQNGYHFVDNIFKRIFLQEKFPILIRIP